MNNHELTLLSICLLENRFIDKAIPIGLNKEWFTVDLYKTLWTGIVNATNKGKTVDILWASDYLKEKTGKSHTIMSRELGQTLHSSGFDTALEIMRKQYNRRQVSNIITNAQRRLYSDDPITITDTMINELTGVREAGTTQPQQNVEDVIKERISTGIKISTGYHKLDHMTRGIEPYVWILAGDSGHLKTTMALNIAYNIAEKKHSVHIFSGEMGRVLLVEKLAIMKSGMNTRYGIPTEHREFFIKTVREIEEMPISITEGISLPQIRIEISKRKADLYIIDYLQKIKSDKKDGTREQIISNITNELTRLRTEYKVCIMAISSLTKYNREEGGAPTLKNLKDSGSIEYDADYVLFLYYKYRLNVFSRKEENSEEERVLRGFMAKNRIYGFEEGIRFDYNKQNLRITEIEEV